MTACQTLVGRYSAGTRVRARETPRRSFSRIWLEAVAVLSATVSARVFLMAKEFVAAQDPADPGVLILSSFTGAASQLTEAILVNPYSPEELADAIGQALKMPLDERKRRWRAMMDNVQQQDVMWWMRSFVATLADTGTDPATPIVPLNLQASFGAAA